MTNDDAIEKDYFRVNSLDELIYDNTIDHSKFLYDEVITQALQIIQYCLKPTTRKKYFELTETSSVVRSRLLSFKTETFNLLSMNRHFLLDLLPSIFWLTHLEINKPDDNKNIKRLRSQAGTIWGKFLFPFETDSSLSPSLRDSFINCIPYFYSQCIHHLFILILDGNPPSTQRSFRLKICSRVVKTFTHIEPLESLLHVNLSFYFRVTPQVDLKSNGEQEKQKFEEPPSSLLPEEDLNTLIEMPHRKRPRSTTWNISGISELISKSSNRTSIPFEHKSNIVVQYPKDGEKDWTTELPPLLPNSSKPTVSYTKNNYDPNQETRSLLFRSRRPEIILDYTKMKRDYHDKIVQKQIEIGEKKTEFATLESKLLKKPLIVIQRFTDDLRNLQLERKWNETPELHKKKELERLEEERKKKLEKEKREAEMERKMRIRKRREEKEAEQDKKDKERREGEKQKGEGQNTKKDLFDSDSD